MALSDLNVNIQQFYSYFIEVHANEARLTVGDGIVWTAGQTMRDNGLMGSYLRKKTKEIKNNLKRHRCLPPQAQDWPKGLTFDQIALKASVTSLKRFHFPKKYSLSTPYL